MANDKSLPTDGKLPLVDDAVLAEISGGQGLTQADLWKIVGEVEIGNLGAWGIGEAERIDATGVSAKDAFLGGMGYVLLALAKQLSRNHDKEKVARLWDFPHAKSAVDSTKN